MTDKVKMRPEKNKEIGLPGSKNNPCGLDIAPDTITYMIGLIRNVAA